MERWILRFDCLLRRAYGLTEAAGAAPPPAAGRCAPLHAAARRRAAGLMRVNHAGEVCAQALYQGQLWCSRDPHVRDQLRAAAQEEQQHLHWCRRRLLELGAAPSRLNPLWHAGSLLLGAGVALAGDRWSLGFLAETEYQVVEHLERHLELLPPGDIADRAVLERMLEDEARHRDQARHAGGRPLPVPLRLLMRIGSGLVTVASRQL